MRPRSGARGRAERAGLQKHGRAGRESQWSRERIAALLLLVGILSLTAAPEWFERAGRPDRILFYDETRSMIMQQDAPNAGTVDRPAATIVESMSVAERSSASFGGLISRVEAIIRRYPWPTLFLGLGVGYLLSRRMR